MARKKERISLYGKILVFIGLADLAITIALMLQGTATEGGWFLGWAYRRGGIIALIGMKIFFIFAPVAFFECVIKEKWRTGWPMRTWYILAIALYVALFLFYTAYQVVDLYVVHLPWRIF